MRLGSYVVAALVLALAFGAAAAGARATKPPPKQTTKTPPKQTTKRPPKETQCGDIAGGRWTVSDYESGTRLTGTHYTVVAFSFPCSLARSFVKRLTHRPSLGPGPTALLPGFMCLTGIPKGMQLQHGSCALGSTPVVVPTAGVKSFTWQACVKIGNQHRTCTTRKP
jgi:hypothetical protein